MTERCPCGRPLHYTDPETERVIREFIAELGEDIPITVGDRTWLVSRHYIALHGVKASELPALGFPEVRGGGIGRIN
jgi:hypothetical protein